MEHDFSKFLAGSIKNLINIDYLKPAEVKESYHTVFARGFAVSIKCNGCLFYHHTRFLKHSAESTKGLHRFNGIVSRASTTLTPRLAAQLGIEPATSRSKPND